MGTMRATGRPATVTVADSPASASRRISLAFWRNSRTPTVLMEANEHKCYSVPIRPPLPLAILDPLASLDLDVRRTRLRPPEAHPPLITDPKPRLPALPDDAPLHRRDPRRRVVDGPADDHFGGDAEAFAATVRLHGAGPNDLDAPGRPRIR